MSPVHRDGSEEAEALRSAVSRLECALDALHRKIGRLIDEQRQTTGYVVKSDQQLNAIVSVDEELSTVPSRGGSEQPVSFAEYLLKARSK